MKKKAKNSLVVIVVLVVVLGVGFGIWKIFFAPKPLKIKDLENMHITTTRSLEAKGWNFILDTFLEDFMVTGIRRLIYHPLGHILDNENVFVAREPSQPQTIGTSISIEQYGALINIKAGDTLEVTLGGGRKLTIYLPEITGTVEEGEFRLYVATDGSTYYDEDLTKLAQKAPIPEKDK